MKTVLMATVHAFWHDDVGDRRRIAAMCRFLTKHFRLAVAYYGPFDGEDEARVASAFPGLQLSAMRPRSPAPAPATALQRCAAEIDARVHGPLREGVRHAGRAGRWLRDRAGAASGRPPEPAATPEPDDAPPPLTWTLESYRRHAMPLAGPFRKLHRRLSPDAVIIQYVYLGFLIDELDGAGAKPCLTLIDTHDVQHVRCRQFDELGETHWLQITEEQERLALMPFDVVIAIQPREAEHLSRMLPGKRVITATHCSAIVHHEPHERSWANVMFVGNASAHNRPGLLAFLEGVWPRVRQQVGDHARFAVVGTACEHLRGMALPEGVELRGYVPDLDRAYGEADILVNPVHVGGGLKIKTVEALCHGRPLVTTPQGAEGLEHGSGQAFLVCDNVDETVRTVVSLVRDGERRESLGREAHRFAEENFAEDLAYAELRATLDMAPKTTPAGGLVE